MKEAKPIALVRCYRNHPQTQEEFLHLRKGIKKELLDYRVLITFDNNSDKDVIEVQVFNGDDITDIQFNELKDIINERN